MIRVIDLKGKPRFLVEKLAKDEGYMKRMGFEIQHLEESSAPEINLPFLCSTETVTNLPCFVSPILGDNDPEIEFNEEINEQLDLLAEEVKPVLKRGLKPNQIK